MAEYSVIGKSVLRVDALDKVTGTAVYSTDIKLPGMLTGKIKTSPCAFARILSVNTKKARSLPGVKAVITAHDVSQFPYGPVIADELPLADSYARYEGDAIAAVAAIDEETAAQALDLIEVEYEELTPLLDPLKAMAPDAPAIHPEREDVKQNIAYHAEYVRGEGEAAFKYADVIVEDHFTTQIQHQGYLEPQACVTQWDASGKLTIWGSTQAPFRVRSMLATAMGIPEHRIRMIQPYLGGGFGGKTYLHPHFPICAYLSRAAGRPVRLVYTREEDFIQARPRMIEIIDVRMGFKKDGTMVAKSVNVIGDGGAYVGATPNIITTSIIRPDCIYRLANIKAVANVVYTNTIPKSPFRGYGNPEMLFATESLIDMAAEKLGLDPMEVRLKNCSQKGDTTVHGWILNTCGLEDSIRLAAQQADWKNKRQKPAPYHGIGMACQVHVAGNRAVAKEYDGSAAIINVDQYGKVKLISGESELGQGMLTVFAQMAAEEMGMDMADVQVLPYIDSDFSPTGHGSSASRVTTLGGNAVRLAARDARRQLIEHAAQKLGVKADDLEIKNSKFVAKSSQQELAAVKDIARDTVLRKLGGVPIIGKGEYVVPANVVMPDRTTKYGNYAVAYAFSAQVAEVAVDPETGKVTVLNVWVGEDIGKALNPKLCEGQIEGGVVQGMGYALSENYVYDKEGKLLNRNFTDYKMPLFANTPGVHSIWVETNEPGGPFGGKSIGEPAMNPTAVAIANAVCHATGVRIKDLPITPEKLLAALKAKK
ncbi:MAG: xanthine dehydrogenase family protein molybdopterin-binding subunit [Chloroflexota bacterium]|nr:xanthine dehydrogenase family protein molybdopterin-binding subunit [Chloroflexota bacterium]